LIASSTTKDMFVPR